MLNGFPYLIPVWGIMNTVFAIRKQYRIYLFMYNDIFNHSRNDERIVRHDFLRVFFYSYNNIQKDLFLELVAKAARNRILDSVKSSVVLRVDR